MSDVTRSVWTGHDWVDLPVASMSGEGLVVPNVAALVTQAEAPGEAVLLQRRDKAGEAVRGRWEVPGGRWRAGEDPHDAVRREVAEETGLEVVEVLTARRIVEAEPHVAFAVSRPPFVVNGLDGAYPSLHVVFECTARGVPRPLAGETAEPRWWPRTELIHALSQTPEIFVWHTATMLRAWLEER